VGGGNSIIGGAAPAEEANEVSDGWFRKRESGDVGRMFIEDGVCERETGDLLLASTSPRVGADCRDRGGEDDLAGRAGGRGTEPQKETAEDIRDRSGD